MGLLDELGDKNYRQAKGPKCSVAQLKAVLPEDTLAKLEAAMANPNAPAVYIADAMEELGYFISGDTIRRHRKGRCRCGK